MINGKVVTGLPQQLKN